MAKLINKIGNRLAAAAKILEFIDGSLGSSYLGPTLMVRGSFAAARPTFIFGFIETCECAHSCLSRFWPLEKLFCTHPSRSHGRG